MYPKLVFHESVTVSFNALPYKIYREIDLALVFGDFLFHYSRAGLYQFVEICMHEIKGKSVLLLS